MEALREMFPNMTNTGNNNSEDPEEITNHLQWLNDSTEWINDNMANIQYGEDGEAQIVAVITSCLPKEALEPYSLSTRQLKHIGQLLLKIQGEVHQFGLHPHVIWETMEGGHRG